MQNTNNFTTKAIADNTILMWAILFGFIVRKGLQNKLMPRADVHNTREVKQLYNAYKVELESKHGVHATFNIGDLSPYYIDLKKGRMDRIKMIPSYY